MRVHWENKSSPTYSLVVGKKGPAPGLKAAPPEDGETSRDVVPGGRGAPNPVMRLMERRGLTTLDATRVTMFTLAGLLQSRLHCPVEDLTGLKGAFKFTLEWAEDALGFVPGDPHDKDPPGIGHPTLFDALREQLGLQLNQTKGPIQLLIVDHADRLPTPD